MVLLPLVLVACQNEASPPPPPADIVTPALQALAEKARPGVLGVAILDLGTGEMTGVNAEKPMPMQSVLKLPLASAVMDAADKGKLSLDPPDSLAREHTSDHPTPTTRQPHDA